MSEAPRHPFLQGLSKHRGTPPTVIVIFGASGDLTARKLIPAIYNLAFDHLLPADFFLVGYGRKAIPDAEFREIVWSHVEANTTYVAGGYDEAEAFVRLAKHIDGIETKLGRDVQVLLYISTPPSVFAPILRNLGASGLASRRLGTALHTKVIIEKPFGKDLESAVAL
nr:glucose-6-phosphate dehydrogenase [Opitutaceae bacterium]